MVCTLMALCAIPAVCRRYHRFCIAVENNVGVDYVTEKVWDCLRVRPLPDAILQPFCHLLHYRRALLTAVCAPLPRTTW